MINLKMVNSQVRTIEIQDTDTGEAYTKGFSPEDWDAKTQDELFEITKNSYLNMKETQSGNNLHQ